MELIRTGCPPSFTLFTTYYQRPDRGTLDVCARAIGLYPHGTVTLSLCTATGSSRTATARAGLRATYTQTVVSRPETHDFYLHVGKGTLRRVELP
jgi:hypothetical protein